MKSSASYLLLFLAVTASGQHVGQPDNVRLTQNSTRRPPDIECGISMNNFKPTDPSLPPTLWTLKFVYPPAPAGSDQISCLGTLIRPNVVITAAQCVQTIQPVQVRTSECDDENSKECLRGITRIISHSNYSTLQPNQENDVALVQLDQIFISAGFACLPNSKNLLPPISNLFVNAQKLPVYTLVGANLHKKGATIGQPGGEQGVSPTELVPLEKCRIIYNYNIRLMDSHLCGKGYGPQPVEPCTGDSGGSLLTLERNTHWTLVGIVSLGLPKCADDEKPTIYTNVGSHLQWIQDNLKSLL